MSNIQNVKYQKIYEAAKDLFLKFGLRRVSVDEICRSAGVSRMTFYKFFRNKLDAAKKILDDLVVRAERRYDEIMAGPVSFGEKIEQVLKLKVGYGHEYGELVMQLLTAGDAEAKAYIQQMFQKYKQASLQLLEQGKKEGVIRADLNPEFYLYTLEHMQTMLTDERLQAIFPDARERSSELAKFWFYGMFDAIG